MNKHPTAPTQRAVLGLSRRAEHDSDRETKIRHAQQTQKQANKHKHPTRRSVLSGPVKESKHDSDLEKKIRHVKQTQTSKRTAYIYTAGTVWMGLPKQAPFPPVDEGSDTKTAKHKKQERKQKQASKPTDKIPYVLRLSVPDKHKKQASKQASK